MRGRGFSRGARLMKGDPRDVPLHAQPSWTGRSDPEEGQGPHRWHESIRGEDLQAGTPPAAGTPTPAITLIGFPVDEGVKRNQGRTGAAQGPRALREALSNLPLLGEQGEVADVGDIVCFEGDLEGAQSRLAARVKQVVDHGSVALVLGGGHEIALGSFKGLHQALEPDARILVVNFDAHFDLRKGEQPTSGTSFREIHEIARSAGRPLQCRMLGISAFANTEPLFLRALELGIAYRLDEALHTEAEILDAEAELAAVADDVDAIQLSICLDVLPAHVAPGVSAPSPLGISLRTLERLITPLLRSGKVRVAELAELAPSLDLDGRTARVAARLSARIARELVYVRNRNEGGPHDGR
jgi:formiminoglutamase